MSNTTNELYTMCERIRDEIKALYEAEYTDEEREEMEERGEACGLYDYFEDVLDYEYTISSRRDFLGVKVWVALGGPNIYIDSRYGEVVGHWGTDEARVYLPSEICDEINSIFDDIYNCM